MTPTDYASHLRTELRSIRRDMGGISPNLPFYNVLAERAKAIEKKLSELGNKKSV